MSFTAAQAALDAAAAAAAANSIVSEAEAFGLPGAAAAATDAAAAMTDAQSAVIDALLSDTTSAENAAAAAIASEAKVEADAGIIPFYIPPQGLRFRLVGKATGLVLSGYPSYEPYLVTTTLGVPAEPVSDDQWWRLTPGSGDFDNQYMIISDSSDGFCMQADADQGDWGLWNQPNSPGSYFTFQRVSPMDGWFRILNPSSNTKCYMRTWNNPHLGVIEGDYKDFDDQVFKFEFEDMEIVEPIQYHVLYASLSQQKVALGSETTNNNGSVNQNQSLTLWKTDSYFQSFDYTAGFALGVKTTFQVGVPLVVDGKVDVSVSTTHTWHWGQSVTKTTTVEWDIPIVTPPHRKYCVTGYIMEGQLSIPYTVTLMSKKTGYTVTSSGVAKGASYWDAYADFQDLGPSTTDSDGNGGNNGGNGGNNSDDGGNGGNDSGDESPDKGNPLDGGGTGHKGGLPGWRRPDAI